MQREMRNKIQLPEILAPAGSLDKLKVAVLYGASAVYLGGLKFGLRAAADNFTHEELIEGVEFAHERGAKVYVVLNSFLHDSDIEEMDSFLTFIEDIKVDAVIVSDLGVIEKVKSLIKTPIHLSTQATCLNTAASLLWKDMGVDRVILGRECSVDEASKIKKASGLEVEMFIHGSMCMAYSGNCVISNFTQGRDSNRGGCAHSCRFEYSIQKQNEEEKKRAYFMSSTDLNGIHVLKDFINLGIDSIKVEGRMKSHLYAGTMSKVYKEALLEFEASGEDFTTDQLEEWDRELKKVSHRSYAAANLKEKAGKETIFDERLHVKNNYSVVGNVIEVVKDNCIIIEVKKAFETGDLIEILPFLGKFIETKVTSITRLNNEVIERTKPSTLIKIPYVSGVEQFNLIRRKEF